MSADLVRQFIEGNGYYDAEEVLWEALMLCDQCGRRQIDCGCPQWTGASADERLMALGRSMKAQKDADRGGRS